MCSLPNPTTKSYGDCKDIPAYEVVIGKAYDCSVDCQKADWSNHKAICKQLGTRVTLRRIAEATQKIMFLCREKQFGKMIAQIEKKDRKIYIHERKVEGEDQVSESPLHPFPSSLGQSAQDKQAILSYHAGPGAAICALGMMQNMLQGKSKGITSTIQSNTDSKQI
jgi:hypothetical protein